MTAHTVNADRLKTIRTARKIGRPKLAKLSGLSERKLAKIESGKTSGLALSESDVLRLSGALQIPALALTGDLPLIEDDLQPAAKPSCSCCS